MTAKKASHRKQHNEDADEPMPLAPDITSDVVHIRAKFDGIDSPGPCAVPEVVAGDVLLWVLASDGTIGNHGFFEPIVTVDSELQQKKPLTGHSFDAIFLRGLS